MVVCPNPLKKILPSEILAYEPQQMGLLSDNSEVSLLISVTLPSYPRERHIDLRKFRAILYVRIVRPHMHAIAIKSLATSRTLRSCVLDQISCTVS